MQNNQPKQNFLPHQTLRVWREGVELAKVVGANRIENAELRDQAMRAATSVALNIAEGANRDRRAAVNHFRIARGSAGEVAAAYEIAVALGEDVDSASVILLAGRVTAMLRGLISRGG